MLDRSFEVIVCNIIHLFLIQSFLPPLLLFFKHRFQFCLFSTSGSFTTISSSGASALSSSLWFTCPVKLSRRRSQPERDVKVLNYHQQEHHQHQRNSASESSHFAVLFRASPRDGASLNLFATGPASSLVGAKTKQKWFLPSLCLELSLLIMLMKGIRKARVF